jgi:hypothetical protein
VTRQGEDETAADPDRSTSDWRSGPSGRDDVRPTARQKAGGMAAEDASEVLPHGGELADHALEGRVAVVGGAHQRERSPRSSRVRPGKWAVSSCWRFASSRCRVRVRSRHSTRKRRLNSEDSSWWPPRVRPDAAEHGLGPHHDGVGEGPGAAAGPTVVRLLDVAGAGAVLGLLRPCAPPTTTGTPRSRPSASVPDSVTGSGPVTPHRTPQRRSPPGAQRAGGGGCPRRGRRVRR